MNNRPWLNSYPAGMPHEVDVSGYASLISFLDESLQQHADSRFAVSFGRWLSYRDLDALSGSLGAWLQSRGLRKGDRVALMMPNVLQFTISMLAILRAGYVCVNVNPLYTARELEHQLRDSGAVGIIVLENYASIVEQVVAYTGVRHVVLTSIGDQLSWLRGKWMNFAVRRIAKLVPRHSLASKPGIEVTSFARALRVGSSLTFVPPGCDMDCAAFLQYTGGTTGLSKGAILTHRNVVAATLQAETWFAPAVDRLTSADEVNAIAALPLYHIFALTLSLLAMRRGWHMTLIANPRDTARFIKVLKERPFHMLPGVNTLFNSLLNHPAAASVDWSSLALSQAGGMAASRGTAEKWAQLTGSAMVEGWGMTETCAIGTNNVVSDPYFTGTIGLPLPGIELAIKDEIGQSLRPGERGEICIRGPNVMVGYHNQPEETRQAFTADGFLRTGDIGVMDDRGYTRIVDRKKDMILVNGFNVFPSELEDVLSMCPGVLECAVIGVPDAGQGESIKAFVVRSDPALTTEAIVQHCREHLTGYKRPKYVEFREDLPKTNVGKVLRRALRPAGD